MYDIVPLGRLHCCVGHEDYRCDALGPPKLAEVDGQWAGSVRPQRKRRLPVSRARTRGPIRPQSPPGGGPEPAQPKVCKTADSVILPNRAPKPTRRLATAPRSCAGSIGRGRARPARGQSRWLLTTKPQHQQHDPQGQVGDRAQECRVGVVIHFLSANATTPFRPHTRAGARPSTGPGASPVETWSLPGAHLGELGGPP